VGFKPTYGRVSRAGVIPFSETFDHIGPITWTVEDAAIMLQALQGHDPRDAGSACMPQQDLRAGLNDGIKGLRLGFIRHFSEEDQKFSPELTAAVEQALQVFRDIGAQVEDVRLRSLHEYYAVRIVLSETEIFSLHLKDLQDHPGDYGHHFLSRCLPACLFTAADYVGASRERQRMLNEMKPVYEKYDALISVGAGPAPNLSEHKSIGGVAKWLQPSIGALGSVTGAPALAQCCGFSKSGLPLGLQIVGRPWEEAKVLRIARAYEASTPWRNKRPAPHAGPTKDYADEQRQHHPQGDQDERLRSLVSLSAQRAGLHLDERQFALLLEAAPYALKLTERIPRHFGNGEEMATVFSLMPTASQ